MYKLFTKSMIVFIIIGLFFGCLGVRAVEATAPQNASPEELYQPLLSQLEAGVTVTQISTGEAHTCALLSTGSVKCWGENNYGQVGDGTTINRTTPVDVSGLSNAVAISSGIGHTCVMLSTGGVKCWGRNNFGQLGDGTIIDRNTPVDVSGLSGGVSAITSGGYHTCASLNIGGIKCWGRNSSGQLGDGTTTNRTTPVDVSALSSALTAITAGYFHTCVMLSTGGIKCWGGNSYGQLGDGTNTQHDTPVDVSGMGSGVAAISAVGHHTCVLLSTGGVKCWGWNGYGQLGNGTTINSNIPTDVIGLSSGVAAISAGGKHSCVILSTGGVKCWGWNDNGQLGDGTTTQQNSPVDVDGLSSGVAAISAGGKHTCALLSNGGVKCWGWNSSGQLGDGTTTNRNTPVDVCGLSSHFVSITVLDGGLVINTPGNPYLYGETATLEPIPDPGWSFSNWSGANATELSDNGNGTWDLLIDGDKAVTATFTQDEYTVTVTTVGSGSVTNAPGNPYDYGETATLEPTSDPGWSFAVWSGANAAELSDNGNGTWDLLVDGDKAVTATFTQDEYSVTVTTVGNGSVTNTPGNPYNYGETATLEPTADPGWSFAVWSGANAAELVDNGDGTWDLLMDGNKEVAATFTQYEYEVTVFTVGGGSVINTPGNPYLYGEIATLQPFALPGWSFDDWSGVNAGELIDNGDGTWNLLMDGNKEVTATFTQAEYSVTVTTVGSGSVSNSPGNPYYYGHTATLEPVSDPGWSFAGWSGTNALELSTNGDGTWTLLMDDSKEVTATFTQDSSYLFWDDFETGEFSRWSRFNDGGGWLYPCGQAGINGSWGACVERGDNNRRKQLIDETPVDQTTFHTRFSFDPNGLSMNNKERFRFMQTKLLTVRPYFMVMKFLGGQYLIQLRVRQDNATYLNTGWFALSDAPHTIEVDWMAATGPGANDGYGQLWIDDVMVDSVTGLDNDTMYVDTFKIGFTSRLEGKSISGIIYIDDVATSNTGYIGLP